MEGSSENKPGLIMLIDDNDAELYISNRLLLKYNSEIKVISYSMATHAIDYLKQNVSSESIPDIILCDIHMPQMTGFQFLEEFDKFPLKFKEKIKVFLISSTFNTKDLDQSAANPLVTKFFEKPLSLDKIKEIYKLSGYSNI